MHPADSGGGRHNPAFTCQQVQHKKQWCDLPQRFFGSVLQLLIYEREKVEMLLQLSQVPLPSW